MTEKPRIYRGQEHNLTVSTSEYPETKVVTTALMMLTGAFVMIAKYFLKRSRRTDRVIPYDPRIPETGILSNPRGSKEK